MNTNQIQEIENEKINPIVDLIKSSNFLEAEKKLMQLLEKKPNSIICLNFMALCLVNQKKNEEAIGILKKIIEIKPNFSEAYNNLGTLYKQMGSLDTSINYFRKAIKFNSSFTQAYSNLAGLLYLKGKSNYEEAILNCEKAIKNSPNYYPAYNTMGLIYKGLNKFEKSISNLEKAIEIKSDYIEAYNNLGIVLRYMGRAEEAVQIYNKLIKLKPNYVPAYNHLGNALKDCLKIKESIEFYKKASEVNSKNFSNKNGIENLKLDENIKNNYIEIFKNKKNFPLAIYNESLAKLLSGDLEDGFKKYEFRWFIKEDFKKLKYQSIPLWQGKENLKDKKIVVWHEQGIGDAIHFSRYVSNLLNLGAKVYLQTHKRLVCLFNNFFSTCNVFDEENNDQKYDFQIPLMTLPLVFKTNLNNIPKQNFLIPHNLIESWERKLGPKKKKRIGLCWSGNRNHKYDHFRSLELNSLFPLIKNNYEFFCIQKDVLNNEMDQLKNLKIKYLGDEDLLNTGAIIKNLDLVISCDTSICHLSGSLNCPTWLLLHYSPDWRWLLNREDSPWYPSIKLFRQKKLNEWSNVINKIEKELININ